MGGCDGNPTEPMDGDLGEVDIMSGKEEATDGKSFLFEEKKSLNQKKGGRMEGYLLVAKKKKKGKWRYTRWK